MAKSVWRGLSKGLSGAALAGVAVGLLLTSSALSLSTSLLIAGLWLAAGACLVFQWIDSKTLAKLRPGRKAIQSEIRRYLAVRRGVLTAIFLATGIAEYCTYVQYQTRKIEGDLYGANAVEAPADASMPFLAIGNSKPLVLTPEMRGRPAFNFFPDAEFKIEPGAMAPWISTTVRDRSGNLIVKMERNHWRVTDEIGDRNFTNTALEVKDKADHVIFQVWMDGSKLGPTVHVRGEWWSTEGRGIRITEDAENGFVIFPATGSEQYLNHLIKPMFRYPSRDHLGELAK